MEMIKFSSSMLVRVTMASTSPAPRVKKGLLAAVPADDLGFGEKVRQFEAGGPVPLYNFTRIPAWSKHDSQINGNAAAAYDDDALGF